MHYYNEYVVRVLATTITEHFSENVFQKKIPKNLIIHNMQQQHGTTSITAVLGKNLGSCLFCLSFDFDPRLAINRAGDLYYLLPPSPCPSPPRQCLFRR